MIIIHIHYSGDACLMDELGTLLTRRIRTVQRCSCTWLWWASQFCECICFCMQNIPLRLPLFIFTHIFKTWWRSIISIRDDHLVLYQETSHFSPLTIRKLTPFTSHLHIRDIVFGRHNTHITKQKPFTLLPLTLFTRFTRLIRHISKPYRIRRIMIHRIITDLIQTRNHNDHLFFGCFGCAGNIFFEL